MSDNEAAGTAWTETAKYRFLLLIIAQYRSTGQAINWSKIKMPGRTTKSLQNMWTRINKQISEMEAEVEVEAGDGTTTTTTPQYTPRKRGRPSKKTFVDGEETPTKAKSAGKRAANELKTPTKRVKKMTLEDNDNNDYSNIIELDD